jgi:hypothetical protein
VVSHLLPDRISRWRRRNLVACQRCGKLLNKSDVNSVIKILVCSHEDSEAHNLPHAEEKLHESRDCFFTMHCRLNLSQPREPACSGDGRAEAATLHRHNTINLEERMHGWRLPDQTDASMPLPIREEAKAASYHAPAESIGAKPRLDKCQNWVFIARPRRSFTLDFIPFFRMET